MHTSISIRFFFALAMAIAVVAGCSDANAAQSTYLPVHEPCPFGDDGVESEDAMIPGLDMQSLEGLIDDEPPSLEEDFNTDWRESSDTYQAPSAESALFVGPVQEATRASTDGAQLMVDINRANAEELTALPGIGPALAERIIEYRSTRRFDDPSQLQRVQGIGPATLDKLRPHVRAD